MMRQLRIWLARICLWSSELLPCGPLSWRLARWSLIVAPVPPDTRQRCVAWWDAEGARLDYPATGWPRREEKVRQR